MSPAHQASLRINLAEFKAQIVKTLGPDKARVYFSYLTRLLSQKLSKVEFDKLCRLMVGRENLALHNQFIQSILKNAYSGKVPPPLPPANDVTGLICGIGKTPNEDAYLQIPPPNVTNSVISNGSSVLSNGDLPVSPRKVRSAKRDRRLVDSLSALGLNGRTVTAHHGPNKNEIVPYAAEKGDMYMYDLKRPIHQQHQIAEQPDNECGNSTLPPMKKPRLKNPLPDNLHDDSKVMAEVVAQGGQWTRRIVSSSTRAGSPLCAPLGIPFCSASLVRTCRSRSRSSRVLPEVRSYLNAADIGELSGTQTLRKRMESIAEAEGLHGVTVDCANLLNNGLDTYLKKLIRLCIDIAGARSRTEQTKHVVHQWDPYGNVVQGINGVWQNYLMHSQANSVSVEGLQQAKRGPSVSLLDFRVAMELNPQQLGDDWPSFLEKVTSLSFEGE